MKIVIEPWKREFWQYDGATKIDIFDSKYGTEKVLSFKDP